MATNQTKRIVIKGLVLEGVDADTLLSNFRRIEDNLSELGDNLEPKQPAEYLTRREVATLFSVSLPTVHDWTKKGILAAYRIGNRVFYKRAEVEAAATPVRP